MDIVSIGECMIELFSDQPLAEAEFFYKYFAGDSLNMLVAASRLGARTGYITRVGRDPFESYLIRSWQAEGIDTGHVRVVDGFNAVHFISLLPGGEREFVYYRKGSAPSTMEPSDLNPDYIARTRILHVSGITQAISPTARATVKRAVEIASERGVRVSYDTNYRWQLWSVEEARQGFEEIIAHVNIILPSADDMRTLFGIEDPWEAVRFLRGKGVDIAVVKCGTGGAYISAGDEEFHQPAYIAGTAVDTTGAGDAFNGALLYGLTHGWSVRDSALLGAVMSGLKVLGRGAIKSLPTREKALEVFRSLRDKEGTA